jgi:hypothetical protein
MFFTVLNKTANLKFGSCFLTEAIAGGENVVGGHDPAVGLPDQFSDASLTSFMPSACAASYMA